MSIKKKIKPYIPVEFQALGRRIINNNYVKRETKIFKQVVKKYLETHKVCKLQLGSQKNPLNDWLNTDIVADKKIDVYYLDITKNFQILDESFDYVYCEELIEHIDYKEGQAMLHECYRILKPGGKIRIGTPDLRNFIKLYDSNKNKLHKDYVKWIVDTFFKDTKIYSSVFVINNIFRRWGHKFIYDFDTLADSFKRAGFTNIVRRLEGKSSDEHLKNIDQHGISSENKKFRNFESFFAEAQKPLK